MAYVLGKQPPKVAPWPPTGPGLEKKTVNPGEDLGAFCTRVGVTVSEFMKTNFEIELKDPNWQFYFNWYMNKNGIGKAWTAKGNCKFIGGETFYVKNQNKPVKDKPVSTYPKDRGEIVQWFMQDILPQRTIGPGNITNGKFMLQRGGKVLDRLSGGGADPNGICGAAAEFVWEKYTDFGGRPPYTLGYILWQQAGLFTHVANVLSPDLTVLSYTRDFIGDGVNAKAPDGGRARPFSEVQHWTVLDLYFKKVSTVSSWWQSVSYLGWGELVIDPTGQYINQ